MRLRTLCKSKYRNKNRTQFSACRVWAAKINYTDFQWSRIIALAMLWVPNMHSMNVSYIEWLPIGISVAAPFRLCSHNTLQHHTVPYCRCHAATALNSNLTFAAVNLMLCNEYMNYALFILLYFEYIMKFIAHILTCVCAAMVHWCNGQYVNLLHGIVCTHWGHWDCRIP